MENKNLPAFPHEGYKYAKDKPEGLSKRELISAMAMQGMLANPDRNAEIEGFVIDAINFTDALLAALETPKQ